MMRGKLIALEIVLLVLSGGFYVWSTQQGASPENVATDQNQPVYSNLPVNRIRTIELQTADQQLVLRRLPDGDQSTSNQKAKQNKPKSPTVQATLDKGPYRPNYEPEWVVESFHNYGVKTDLVKDRILTPLRKLKKGELESRSKDRLEEFGLDKSSRRRIVLKDQENNVVQDIVLGNRETAFSDAQPGPMGGSSAAQEFIYYYDNRNPKGDFEVRKGASEFGELSVDPQEWVHKQILSFDQENVPMMAIQNKKKLFVLLKKQNQKQSDEESSESEWELYSGDDYAGSEFPRNTILIWRNNQLMWREEQNAPLQSISLTKRKINQSKVSGLVRSLSSLKADQVEKPISVSAKLNRIPDEKKQKYGFSNNSPVIYLGEIRKPDGTGNNIDRGLLIRAKFSLGKTSTEEGSSIYLSSLKTSNTAQKIMSSMLGFSGMGSQAKKVIPVYSISETTLSAVRSPEDLVEKEEDENGGQQDAKSSGESSQGESGDDEANGGGTDSSADTETKTETETSPSGENGNNEDDSSSSTPDDSSTDENTSGGSSSDTDASTSEK